MPVPGARRDQDEAKWPERERLVLHNRSTHANRVQYSKFFRIATVFIGLTSQVGCAVTPQAKQAVTSLTNGVKAASTPNKVTPSATVGKTASNSLQSLLGSKTPTGNLDQQIKTARESDATSQMAVLGQDGSGSLTATNKDALDQAASQYEQEGNDVIGSQDPLSSSGGEFVNQGKEIITDPTSLQPDPAQAYDI